MHNFLVLLLLCATRSLEPPPLGTVGVANPYRNTLLAHVFYHVALGQTVWV